LVVPDPDTICTFTPLKRIVGLPPTPEEMNDMCGSTESNVF
jgi:hypothetical protein